MHIHMNIKSINKKSIFVATLIGAVILSVSFGIFYAGFAFGKKNPNTVIIQGVSNIEGSKDIPADFSLFWEAWNMLKENHIKGSEAKGQDLLYGAIEGLTNSLGDPNTNFFRPDDSKKFEEDVTGNFGGIGAEIGIRNEQLVVIAPLEESPAARAGLKAKDQILEIDGMSTRDIRDVNEAVKKIRGLIGTQVTLTVVHDGSNTPEKIAITRANIEVPTLKSTVLDGNINHIQLYSFNENAPFLFYRAALTTLIGNAQGIILDLRNNPGGFLEVAVNLAGWFVDKGEIVARERFRNGEERLFRSNGNAALKNIPMVILVNKGSASASEILAGALQDHLNIKLVGEQTFGKGTVQELFPLHDNSKLKITIANWLLPKGRLIDHDGLKPDIEVALTEKDITAGNDPQLQKAIEVLQSEIRKKAS